MISAVYLINSLPSLTFGKKPPISIEEFMHDASLQLSKNDFAKLESINMQMLNKGETNVKRKLKSFNELLAAHNEDISNIRNNKDKAVNTSSLPKSLINANPLEREKRIMQLQWDELSSIEFGESYTLTEVLIYKLKLEILLRLKSFNTKKGAEVFESIVNPKETNEE